MLRVGAAGHQEDVVVGTARLARIGPAGRVVAGRPPRRRLAGARVGDEHAAAVMHDGILHRHLQPPALAGARAVEERADDAERHQHAGAGVADRRARLDGLAVALAGDAHRAARGLRDRVERQALFVRAAVAETLDLGIDDARIDRADDVVAEPEPFDRTGREVLGEDIGLLYHLLDQLQAAVGLQIDRQRALVGVVHHEIIRIAKAGAAGLAARRLDLGDVGAHPGKRLGARRAGLELRQVEHANTGEAAGRCGSYVHCGLLIEERTAISWAEQYPIRLPLRPLRCGTPA